jgi:hypothetical protein
MGGLNALPCADKKHSATATERSEPYVQYSTGTGDKVPTLALASKPNALTCWILAVNSPLLYWLMC